MTLISKKVSISILLYTIFLLITITIIKGGSNSFKPPFSLKTGSLYFNDIALNTEHNSIRHLSLSTPQKLFSRGYDHLFFEPIGLFYSNDIIFTYYPNKIVYQNVK